MIHRQPSKVSSRSTVVYVYCAASDSLLALTNFDVQTTIAHGTDPSLDIRLGPSQLQPRRRPRFDHPRTNLTNRSTSSNKANAAHPSRLERTTTTASSLKASHENHILRSRQTLSKIFCQSLTSSFWPLGRCTKETSNICGRLYVTSRAAPSVPQLVFTVHSTCKAHWPCRCSTKLVPQSCKQPVKSLVLGINPKVPLHCQSQSSPTCLCANLAQQSAVTKRRQAQLGRPATHRRDNPRIFNNLGRPLPLARGPLGLVAALVWFGTSYLNNVNTHHCDGHTASSVPSPSPAFSLSALSAKQRPQRHLSRIRRCPVSRPSKPYHPHLQRRSQRGVLDSVNEVHTCLVVHVGQQLHHFGLCCKPASIQDPDDGKWGHCPLGDLSLWTDSGLRQD